MGGVSKIGRRRANAKPMPIEAIKCYNQERN
jgi:hypothetical protein